MSFTVTDFPDLLRIVETHTEWRRKLVRALFPEIDVPKALQELAEAQCRTEAGLQRLEAALGRLEATVEKLAVGQQVLQQDVGELKQDVGELKGRTQRLETSVDKLVVGQQALRRDVGELKGKSHEQFYQNRADAIFGRYLKGGKKATAWIADRLQEALAAGRISEAEYDQVMASDLLWGGRARQTEDEVILALEASWLAEANDVERAVARAVVLRRIGLKALPVVASREWAEDAPDVAREQGAVLVTDGHVDSASWQEALLAAIGDHVSS